MQQQTVPWKLSQVFGEENAQEQDMIGALAFDMSGSFLAVGDNAGRLILFEKPFQIGGFQEQDFKYAFELQSHVKEQDFLK